MKEHKDNVYTGCNMEVHIGDIIKSNDGSGYLGIVVDISLKDDFVKHVSLITNREYIKSYIGFGVRYRLANT